VSTGCNSGQMVKNVALVLGGGWSAGHAWTIGVIAGLAEAGIDMTETADLVTAVDVEPQIEDSLRGAIAGNWFLDAGPEIKARFNRFKTFLGY